MRAVPLLFQMALVTAFAMSCDEGDPRDPPAQGGGAGGGGPHSSGGRVEGAEQPEASGGHDASGGTAAGGWAASGGWAMGGATDGGEACDPDGPIANPWSLPNIDLSRRAVFAPNGAQCGPGVEVDKWGGYFNELFVDCRAWPFDWPSDQASSVSGYGVRSLVLKQPLVVGAPFAISTDITSAVDVRVEVWGTCGSCAGPIEFLGGATLEASSKEHGVCFDLEATAPHTHLLLLMSDVNAAHGHIRFCSGQVCVDAP